MCTCSRRSVLTVAASACAALLTRGEAAPAPEHRAFVEAAFRMKEEAVKSGDRPYGAVVAKHGRIIGFGPSRVVLKNDWTAHAEREAIREAQARLGRDLAGCLLYFTSRPCAACEAAAFEAKIARMYYGPDATDAGPPRAG